MPTPHTMWGHMWSIQSDVPGHVGTQMRALAQLQSVPVTQASESGCAEPTGAQLPGGGAGIPWGALGRGSCVQVVRAPSFSEQASGCSLRLAWREDGDDSQVLAVAGRWAVGTPRVVPGMWWGSGEEPAHLRLLRMARVGRATPPNGSCVLCCVL